MAMARVSCCCYLSPSLLLMLSERRRRSRRSSGMLQKLLQMRSAGRGLPSIKFKTQHFSASLRLELLDELLRQQQQHHHWDLALLVYEELRKLAWSGKISQVVSRMVALLAKLNRRVEMENVLRDTDGRLSLCERMKFECNLIGSYAQLGLWDDALRQFDSLQSDSGPQRFRSLLHAQASMDLPQDAERTSAEMRIAGYEPCVDDYKAVLFSYGRCGYFESMERVLRLMQDHQHPIDAPVFNMMLVSYGIAHKYVEIQRTLQQMLEATVIPTIKSLNALTDACPSLSKLIHLEDKTHNPQYLNSLLSEISLHISSPQEMSIVKSVLELGLPAKATSWLGSTWTLDLHGMSMGTAYLILVVWLKEMASRLVVSQNVPNEVVLITGWGKHNREEGGCSVKSMVVDKLTLMQSPFKIDRYNKGRLVARGHLTRRWLL